MNVHKNAKLTRAGRALLVQRLLARERTEDVAREMGVSRRTAFKWKKRYREEGETGVEDRSSRPHRTPNRLPRQRRRQVERLRRKRWSTPRIARETGILLSTVGAECRRLGLGRLPSLEPPVPVVRYERDRPGELVHLDTKKLARIEAVGHRIHGHRSRRVDGAGWEFLHVCVDDATRLAYAEVGPDEKGATAAGFLGRAAAWFERQGMKIERVMTDNRSCYRSKVFWRAVEELEARHIFTRPYTPRTNGRRSGSSEPPRSCGPTPGSIRALEGATGPATALSQLLQRRPAPLGNRTEDAPATTGRPSSDQRAWEQQLDRRERHGMRGR